MKKRAKVANVEDYAEILGLKDSLLEADARARDEMLKRKDDAGFVAEAADVLKRIKALDEVPLDAKAKSAVADGIALGSALRDLLGRGTGKPEEALTAALRAFYNERREAGFSAPSVTKAREFLRDNRRELYEAKRREKPRYWQGASFRQQWLKLCRRFESERDSR